MKMQNRFFCPKCGNIQFISIAPDEQNRLVSKQICVNCGSKLILECCGECEHCEKTNCN